MLRIILFSCGILLSDCWLDRHFFDKMCVMPFTLSNSRLYFESVGYSSKWAFCPVAVLIAVPAGRDNVLTLVATSITFCLQMLSCAFKLSHFPLAESIPLTEARRVVFPHWLAAIVAAPVLAYGCLMPMLRNNIGHIITSCLYKEQKRRVQRSEHTLIILNQNGGKQMQDNDGLFFWSILRSCFYDIGEIDD